MADLNFTLIPDMKKMVKEMNDLFKKRYVIQADVKATSTATTATAPSASDSGSKEAKEGNSKQEKSGKKTASLLGGIMKALGPIAILLSLKPVTDLLKIISNYAILAFFGIMKVLKGLWNSYIDSWKEGKAQAKELLNKLKEALSEVWIKIVEWLGIAIDWIKELPGKIWTKLKEGFTWLVTSIFDLATKIGEWLLGIGKQVWEWIKIGFDWIVGKLTLLWEVMKGIATAMWNLFKAVLDKYLTLLKNTWEALKSVAGWIWDKMKVGFEWIKTSVTNVWNAIKSLPGLIWDKVKQLASLIGNAIKSSIGNLNPFKSSTSVNDAIIKPDGSVIKTHPNDTIIATKNPGGMGGGSKVFNFYGVTSQKMIDEVKRVLATDVNSTSRF